MNEPKYSLTNESISIVWEGKPYVVQKSSAHYAPLKKAILDENWTDVPNHLTVAKSVESWAKGEFSYNGNNNRFLYKGQELPAELNRRIIEMAGKGESPEPFFAFWERLQKNPSYRSVKQLFPFMAHIGIPLTKDGCFLAYKSVRSDYLDHHSSTFDNRPGKVLEMPRNQISDDPDVPCHEGFHVGALEYANTFGRGPSIILVVKVRPEDVVCVPKDESFRKMRVSRYEVLGHYNGRHMSSTVFIDEDDVTDRSGQIKVSPEDVKKSDDDGSDIDIDVDEDSDGDSDDSVMDQDDDNAPPPPEPENEEPTQAKPDKPASFQVMNEMGLEKLMKQPLDNLRQYAGKHLKIIGASKIGGGKSALVRRILEVRPK